MFYATASYWNCSCHRRRFGGGGGGGKSSNSAISEVPRSVVRCRGFYINAQDMIDELVFDDQGSD